MAYVDYCLIINLYGKPRKEKPITKFREQYKYDLRIIIVIMSLIPIGKTEDMTYICLRYLHIKIRWGK